MNEFETQKKLIKIEDPIIFDVGAYIGGVSSIYRKLFPNATIYVFEPYKESFNELLNVSEKLKLIPYNKAISNINGNIEFNINAAAQTNSILSTHPDGDRIWDSMGYVNNLNKTIVESITIDTFLENNNIEKIDILKLDTQGTEYMVIEGAVNSIKENRINIIYTEIITLPTYIGQKYLDEVLNIFRINDFNLYDVYNQSYTNDNKLRQVDAIFVHNSFYTKNLKNNQL